MTPNSNRQIQLILRHEVKSQIAALSSRLNAIYAAHAAVGRLQSGATVKVALEAMGQMVRDSLDRLGPRILQISPDPDAHNALATAITDLLELFREHVSDVLRMAGGKKANPLVGSADQKAFTIFGELEADIETRLEILSFEFNPSMQLKQETRKTLVSNKGGRPPAEFWDDMWAAIASALYVGDLDPKSQADIERAMASWIDANGQSAADSTIRRRARRLWDRIAALDK